MTPTAKKAKTTKPVPSEAEGKPAAAKKAPAAKKAAPAHKAAAAKKAEHETAPATAAAHAPAHHHAGSYIYAIGRRKSAIAQVRLFPAGKGVVTVNDKPLKAYLPVDEMHESVTRTLKVLGLDATADVVVKAHGGGIRGQADAIKLGIARAAIKMNPDTHATLKPLGYLTRDPREKERKKYGLKKARKSPQWAKR